MRSSITLHGHRYSAIAGEARGGTVASSRERLISVSALTGSGVRAYGRRSKRNNMHYQQNRASVRAGLATQHTPYRRDTSKLDREGSHCYVRHHRNRHLGMRIIRIIGVRSLMPRRGVTAPPLISSGAAARNAAPRHISSRFASAGAAVRRRAPSHGRW